MGNQKGDGPDPLPPITLRPSAPLSPVGGCVTESVAHGSTGIESAVTFDHLTLGGAPPAAPLQPSGLKPAALHRAAVSALVERRAPGGPIDP